MTKFSQNSDPVMSPRGIHPSCVCLTICDSGLKFGFAETVLKVPMICDIINGVVIPVLSPCSIFWVSLPADL